VSWRYWRRSVRLTLFICILDSAKRPTSESDEESDRIDRRACNDSKHKQPLRDFDVRYPGLLEHGDKHRSDDHSDAETFQQGEPFASDCRSDVHVAVLELRSSAVEHILARADTEERIAVKSHKTRLIPMISQVNDGKIEEEKRAPPLL
jgi:hypothetical protein